MFITELVVTHLVRTNSLRVKEPLIYSSKEIMVTVPVGFIYDGASIPKIFNNLLPKMGARYDRAACLHDWLYSTHMLSRLETDKLFYKTMVEEGVNRYVAKLMYGCVRLFAHSSWVEVSEEDAKKLRDSLITKESKE